MTRKASKDSGETDSEEEVEEQCNPQKRSPEKLAILDEFRRIAESP